MSSQIFNYTKKKKKKREEEAGKNLEDLIKYILAQMKPLRDPLALKSYIILGSWAVWLLGFFVFVGFFSFFFKDA